MKTPVLLLVLAAGCASASFLTNAMFEDYNPIPTLNDTDSLLGPCIQRKDYKALHKTMSAIDEYYDCYRKGSVILDATMRGLKENSPSELFAAMCRISRSVESKCTDVFSTNIRPCLEGIDIDALQLYKETSLAIHIYLCSNRGRHFTDLHKTMSVNATDCAREKWQCIRSHLQGAYRTGYGFLQHERFLLTPEGCRSRKEAVACLSRTSYFCDGESDADVIDGFFNSSTAVATPCIAEDDLQWADN